MDKEKNKCLDDEQVKKNIEQFTNDREVFLKEVNVLDFGEKSNKIESRDDLIKKNINNKSVNKEKSSSNDEKKAAINEENRKKKIKIVIILVLLFMMFCFIVPNFVLETGNCSMGLLSGLECSSNIYFFAFFVSSMLLAFLLIIF